MKRQSAKRSLVKLDITPCSQERSRQRDRGFQRKIGASTGKCGLEGV